jgi:NADH-quinone oxidoreductase subunit G
LRKAVKRGARISVMHSSDDDLLFKPFAKAIAAPSQLPRLLAEVVKAAAELKGVAVDIALIDLLAPITPTDAAKKIAASLCEGRKGAILLGNFAQQHPQAATLNSLAQQLSTITSAKFGYLGEAANSVGGYVANALPANAGLNVAQMIAQPRQAYVLLGTEPELDCADGFAAIAALKQAKTVVALTAFKSAAMLDYADVLLPIAPFAETSGTFVNTEGRVQSFYAVTKPQGETRPAWKVLRVLGNLLNVVGFDYESSEQVRDEVLFGQTEFVGGLDNAVGNVVLDLNTAASVLERVADVPLYFADALVRRAPSLQAANDAAAPTLRANAATLSQLGVAAGERVRVKAAGSAQLLAELDSTVANGCVRIAAAHADTAGLGAMFGAVTVEKA